MFNHASVKEIQPLPDYLLLATFVNGDKKLYDVKPWIAKNPAFKVLKEDTALFSSVHVDCGGFGISWNDDVDLDAEELFHSGKDI